MNTKEDYLTKHEKDLLDKLSNTFDSLNRNIIALFSLLLVFFLFRFNVLADAELVGLKLKITQDQALILFPIGIAIPYLLINNSIFRIANIIDLLKTNSNEVLNLNADARPFLLEDLFYLTDGVAGLQLSLSKWIVEHLISERLIEFDIKIPTRKNFASLLHFTLLLPYQILRSIQQLGNKVLYTIFFILLLVSVYIFPIGSSIFFLWNDKLNSIFENFNFWTDLFN